MNGGSCTREWGLAPSEGRRRAPGAALQRIMARSRLFRFRDRASYKPSEVLGLFIISVFLTMIICGLCMLIDHAVRQLFG
jgi:hypothetical protein